jgi:anti-sigma factor RsiW
MTCQQLVELVTQYFDGKLSWRQKRRFEKHIAACEWCTRYIEQMRVTIRTVGRLDAESITPAMRDELLGAFRTWNAGS